jgi:CubicO group peptidase (beta-lactamase class C family)
VRDRRGRPGSLRDLEAFFSDRFERGRFSGSAFVRLAGHVVLDRGYGVADRTTGRPNSPETIFQIASVSKQFAAAAVLRLQERNRLSVHDSVRSWIDDAPESWAPITVHHLLTHTSGLGHWRDFPDLSLFAPSSRERLLRIFSGRPLKFPPGTGWAYSSPGYVVLAWIVERASGDSYATFLERDVLRPIGLADTGAGSHAPRPDRRALGYVRGRPSDAFELDSVGVGAGDVWSTTRDLAQWNAALAVPDRLLSDRSLSAMFAPHAGVTNGASVFAGIDGTRYGYGWYLAEVGGHRLRWHPGDNAGFCSLNAWLPETDSAIVLLSNDESSDLASIGLDLVRGLESRAVG